MQMHVIWDMSIFFDKMMTSPWKSEKQVKYLISSTNNSIQRNTTDHGLLLYTNWSGFM